MINKPISELIVTVVDQGIFSAVAAKIAESVKQVYYCRPGAVYDSFPLPAKQAVGEGFPNVKVIRSVYDEDVYKKTDLWWFPDVYMGEWQTQLEADGKIVWGSRNAERLEIDRPFLKRTMEHLGLKVNKWEIVKGITALRKYLQSHPEQVVKISGWIRGLTETFKAASYPLVKDKLDELQSLLGPKAETEEFLVEEVIDSIAEVGFDGYDVDGKYPSPVLCGIEEKGCRYVGVVQAYSKQPEAVTEFTDAIAPELRRYGMRGELHTETRMTSAKRGVMIDPAFRCGCPSSNIGMELYTNFVEIAWLGAQGQLVQPVIAGAENVPEDKIKVYGVEQLMFSTYADKNWMAMEIPKDVRQYVKLRHGCMFDGLFYNAPQNSGASNAGSIVGWGKSLAIAEKMVEEVADEVTAFSLDIDVNFDKLHRDIDALAQAGVEMF